MVGIALTGSLYTLFMTAGTTLEGGGTQNMTINHASIFTIIGPALLIAALGAAAVIFMTGRTRDRNNALIETGGGTLATTTLSAAFETIIYVGTAFLTGALVYGAVGLVATAALMQVSDTATPVYGVGISNLCRRRWTPRRRNRDHHPSTHGSTPHNPRTPRPLTHIRNQCGRQKC